MHVSNYCCYLQSVTDGHGTNGLLLYIGVLYGLPFVCTIPYFGDSGGGGGSEGGRGGGGGGDGESEGEGGGEGGCREEARADSDAEVNVDAESP